MTTQHLLQQFRSPWAFAVGLSIICVLVWLLGNDITNVLQYDRSELENGEWWRAITAHITHLSFAHLALNIGGLALTWILFGRLLSTVEWITLFAFSAMFISIGVWLFNLDIFWYVGLSGVLHGFFIAGGLADLRVRRWEGIAFLVVVGGKLVWEQIFGPLPGSEESAGGPVLVDAHFYGGISGVIWFGLKTLWQKKR